MKSFPMWLDRRKYHSPQHIDYITFPPKMEVGFYNKTRARAKEFWWKEDFSQFKGHGTGLPVKTRQNLLTAFITD